MHLPLLVKHHFSCPSASAPPSAYIHTLVMGERVFQQREPVGETSSNQVAQESSDRRRQQPAGPLTAPSSSIRGWGVSSSAELQYPSLWAAWECLEETEGQQAVRYTSDMLSQFHTTSWCGGRKFDFPCVNSKGLGYLQLLVLYASGWILQGAGAEMLGCGRYSVCWHLETELPICIPSLPSRPLPAQHHYPTFSGLCTSISYLHLLYIFPSFLEPGEYSCSF